MLRLLPAASTIGDPLVRLRRGPSDHVPLRVVLALKPSSSTSARPVPLWVCKSPLFPALVDKYTAYLNVNLKTGWTRWAARKCALRAVRSVLLDVIVETGSCRASTPDLLTSMPS